MRFIPFLIVIGFLTTFTEHVVFAQTVNLEPFGSISGTQSNELLGTVVRKAVLKTGELPTLFIGAPGGKLGNISNVGRIYKLTMPVESDTALTREHIIIEGANEDDLIGQFFNVGDFNGDGELDVVAFNPNTSSENGKVLVFYGPFQFGNILSPNEASITIDGVNKENLGAALAVVPPISGSNKSGLLIGASASNNFTGKAYYFKDLNTKSTFLSTEAETIFNGLISFDVFAETLQSLGDINGDGETDIAISAIKHTNNLSLQGATYVFFGPFDSNSYTIEDASFTIFGRNPNTLWAGKIFTHGDLDSDGFADFSLSSDGDVNGVVAYFKGREVWADSIYIGATTNPSNNHLVLTSSNASGFGFFADLSGDYNFDGSLDYLISSPYSFTRSGQVSITNTNGSILSVVSGGYTNGDGLFGTQIVRLANINSTRVDQYAIDDVVISAPGANAPVKFNSVKTGVLTLFTGKVNPPRSSLSLTSGSIISLIGDSTRITIASTRGSRPIEINRLYVVKNDGGVVTRDSTDLNTISSYSTSKWFKLENAGIIEIRHYVKDVIGIEATTSSLLRFAALPLDFNLSSTISDTLLIKGDRTKTISFTNEASADTNGASISYDLIFGAELSSFKTNQGLSLIKTSSNPSYSITYQELNTYLINNGFLNLNQVGKIYWSVRARNIQSGVNLFSKMASNGPREISFSRGGLDPFFDITSSQTNLIIEGFDTDKFNFNWSSLISENPNAIVDYKFVLLKDTTSNGRANPIISEYSDPTLANTYSINFNDLTFVLEQNGVFQKAKDDTVKWYYTIQAIIDGQETQPVLPKQRYKKLNIKYVIVLNELEKNNLLDLPTDFEIYPNYPNPFNPNTQLKYALPEASTVKIVVFNLLGQVVLNWQSSGMLNAGFHEHSIQASSWSSGIYIYQIQAGNKRLTGKMSLVK